MGWELDVAHGVAIAAGWGLMYEGIRRVMRWIGKGDRSGEWSCRMVCVLHAGGAVVLSGLSNLYWGPLCYYSLGQPNTPLQTATIQVRFPPTHTPFPPAPSLFLICVSYNPYVHV